MTQTFIAHAGASLGNALGTKPVTDLKELAVEMQAKVWKTAPVTCFAGLLKMYSEDRGEERQKDYFTISLVKRCSLAKRKR